MRHDGGTEERVFMVTGTSGGLAESVCRRLSAAGLRLCLVDRHMATTQALMSELGAHGVEADLTSGADAHKAVQDTLDHFGRLDGLIHLVGGFRMGPADAATTDDYDFLFDVNMRTLFETTRAALPHLRASPHGVLAGISAGPAFTGSGPQMALYGAAKAAVTTFLRSVDAEQENTRLSVMILYPMGAIDTPANRLAMPDVNPATWINPDEIAQTLVYGALRGPGGRLSDLPIYPPR